MRFRVFGTFSIGDAGSRLRIRSRRGRALIAYLTIAGPEGASRERLSGLLWSDRGEDQARASLRQCLLELRRELEEAGIAALETGREQVALRQGAFTSDLEELQQAIRQHDGAALAAALRSIGPDALLDDLSVGGLFDEWLLRTRAQIESAIELEVRTLIEAAEASRAWDQLRAIAEAFLLRSPTDEVVAAAAIRADMAQGITSAAHRRFRALENTLAQEYGLRPGSGVSEALSARRPEPPAPSITTAPPPPAAATDSFLRPIVVVSAFEGPDPGAAPLSLSDLFRDEVISGLSRFRDLVLVTDPQPMTQVDPTAFSEPGLVFALGARAASSGMSVQLIRLQTRSIVWSERFEVPENEIVSATDRIVSRVVGAIMPSIDTHLVMPSREAGSDSMYLQFLRARRRALSARTHDDAQGAAEDLRGLIAAYPNFVAPYPQLARLYNTDFHYTRAGSSDADAYAQALQLAKTALSLDRGHDHCYTLAAWCYLRGRQWDLASQFLEQALSRNRFNARRLAEVGFGLVFLDEPARAREILNRCLLINPTPEDVFFFDLGLLEMVCGNHERAATYFELVATPSIWNTVYQSMNAHLAGVPAAHLDERAWSRIVSIWPAGHEMTDDAVAGWIRTHHPFRSRDVEQRFEAGARMLLASVVDPARPAARALS